MIASQRWTGFGGPPVHGASWRTDQHRGPTRLSTAVLRDVTHWDEVVTKLGYEHLRRHDLRHTGLTWMADARVPLHVLREIAGHGSLTTTQRYLHPDRDAIAAAERPSAPIFPDLGPKLKAV